MNMVQGLEADLIPAMALEVEVSEDLEILEEGLWVPMMASQRVQRKRSVA